MEVAAIGAATGLVGSVLNLLSNELVEAYVASTQLGLNYDKIRDDLMLAQGLLHEAQTRGVSNNPGLEGLLQRLTIKADEADDVLDELHYFIIQDQLDGTRYAVPDLGDDLRGHARHGRHTLRHAVGNCLACFSCSSPMQHDGDDRAAAAVARSTHNATKNDSRANDDPVDKLKFDRVAKSKKIKSVIEELHSLCEPVSKLLCITPHHSTTATVNRRQRVTGSTITQDTLYGRRAIFEKTIDDILTTATDQGETLSVLPVVGPGGIGKTTFTQHLYNDKRVEEHFAVRVWVCVSTDFDVLKLSQQILGCIPGCSNSNQTSNLAELQTSIAQMLKSKRFFIVFDDIWECNSEGWKTLLAPFIKGEAKGNMVLVTTRFPSQAEMVKTTGPIALQGLEFDEFFIFFKALIFGGNKHEYWQEDLDDLAIDIAKKLKGSPLAAKTVGRLLRKKISRGHWIGVLENNEWQKQKNDDDIMPSLRISYDYLPFHLKKCFSYFSLFPEDYRFKNLDITFFWIALGIIEKDENYIEELVENGFLVKEVDGSEQPYYLMHDLLHELSRSVSSQECLNICSSSFRVDAIPQTVRHLSITMEDRYEGNFRGEMVKLRGKIDIGNLRALMIFRKYGETIDGVLKDIFKEIEGLRVLYIVVESQEYLPLNFSKIIHLRYLKITRQYAGDSSEITLHSTLSRCYHLKFLDFGSQNVSSKLAKDISRLINLRHLCVEKGFHSNVPWVGKMKCLQELKEFCVKKESVGFELRELGELTELGGELNIHNLEKVATKEEAMEAKLGCKRYLKELGLVWGGEHQHSTESDVLDALQPHPNLGALNIINHGGTTGPSWLCGDISIKMLGSLHLEGVSWVTLPPFGQLLHLTSLTLISISTLCHIRPGFGGITDKSFMQLKRIILHSLPEFIEWVGVPNAHSFSKLEYIHCSSCPNLHVLPFLHVCPIVSYNHLRKLEILSCPKLSMPSMPHTSTITDVIVADDASSISWHSGCELCLSRYSGVLAWHNIADKLKSVKFIRGAEISWEQLSKLTSLWNLEIIEDPRSLSIAPLSKLTSLTRLGLLNCENITMDGFNPLITLVNLKELEVYNRDHPRSVAADLLSDLVMASRAKNVFPATGSFFQLEKLEVDSSSAALVAPICTLLAATLQELSFWYDKRVESLTEEEENALQLLTSLQHLSFVECQGLPSLPQRLHDHSSLKKLEVIRCAKIRSLPKEGIPNSLKELVIVDCGPELRDQVYTVKQKYPDLQVSLPGQGLPVQLLI